MADKVEKQKKQKAKPKPDEQGVLAALPSTRPQRIGTRRASAPKTFAKPEAAQAAASPGRAKAAAKPKAAAAKPKASAPATTAKPKVATAAKQPTAPRAKAARQRAAAPRTFEPTPAAEAAAGPDPAPLRSSSEPAGAGVRAAGAVPRTETPRVVSEPRPRAVREGAPGIGTIDEREQSSSEHGRPSGVELVTTAIQAAGELTRIGLAIGARTVKRALDRLPRP